MIPEFGRAKGKQNTGQWHGGVALKSLWSAAFPRSHSGVRFWASSLLTLVMINGFQALHSVCVGWLSVLRFCHVIFCCICRSIMVGYSLLLASS